jgi:hypothetical protein
MILIAMLLVGVALVVPQVLRLVRHQPMTGGSWAALVLGGVLLAAVLYPIVKVFIPTKQD